MLAASDEREGEKGDKLVIRKYRSKSYLESGYNFTLADHRDTELGEEVS